MKQVGLGDEGVNQPLRHRSCRQCLVDYGSRSSHLLTVSTSGTTPTRYHHGDLRTACIRAGLEMVAGGHLDFSMRDLARQLGVSHQAPYHHFAGREELLGAIREEGFQEFLGDLRRAREASADPRTALHRIGYAFLEFAQRRPHHYRLMFSVPASDEATTDTPDSAVRMPSAAADSFEELHGCIRDLQAVGEYPGRASLDVAVAVWAWSHGLALLLSQGQLRWLGYGDRLTPELFGRWAALLPTAESIATHGHSVSTRARQRSNAESSRPPARLKASSRGRSSPNG